MDSEVRRLEDELNKSLEHLKEELKKLRTGRAHPSMLDGVMVEAYGSQMPLLQVGSVSAPEPQLLQITPFDANNLEAVNQAIRDNASLGLNPTDDGRVIRIPLPPLNEERRQEIVKVVHEKREEAMISMRNARHATMKTLDSAKKDKSLSQNEYDRLSKKIEQSMDDCKQQAAEVTQNKEKDLLTV